MTNDLTVTTKRPRRPLAELDLMDDFLFHQILMQKEDGPEFCRILLSTILGRPIRKVQIVPQKNVLGIDTDRHGIRLDAYIEDVSESESMSGMNMADAQILPDIYDLEPNRTFDKISLPKRMRYYHGLIDTQLLSTGVKYDQLQNLVIIFILPYDPFGKNRMIYTIQNQCIEDSSVPYNDGATKIFLYTKGTEGNPSQELKDMLQYMENTINENVTNQNLDTIHHIVENAKLRREVGISYMKSWELEEMYRQEGIDYGIMALITTCQELGLTMEETSAKVGEKFSLRPFEVRKYMEQHWKP